MKASLMTVLEIRIDDEAWNGVADCQKLLADSARAALDTAGAHIPAAAISILLTGNRKMARLNSRWRGKNRPTNILSFPARDGVRTDCGAVYLGDMVIAYGVVKSEAESQMKSFETHLCHLAVHGVLHLLGYDHCDDHEAETMESLEICALQALGIANPYDQTVPDGQ